MLSYAIIIASDKCYRQERIDGCEPVITNMLSEPYSFHSTTILPDEQIQLEQAMIRLCDQEHVDLILVSGGTGWSMRDVTPEATKAVIHRDVPGLGEAMRIASMQVTSRAMLSRAIAGIRYQTLIVNLPGSPKAVKECLQVILDPLQHGLEILKGSASECATK